MVPDREGDDAAHVGAAAGGAVVGGVTGGIVAVSATQAAIAAAGFGSGRIIAGSTAAAMMASACDGPQPGKFMVVTKKFHAFDTEEQALRFFHELPVLLAKVMFCPAGRELQARGWNGLANDTIRRRHAAAMYGFTPRHGLSGFVHELLRPGNVVALHSASHKRFVRIIGDPAEAVAGGGTVAAGGAVAMLQGAGAVGLAAAAPAVAAGGGVAAGGAVASGLGTGAMGLVDAAPAVAAGGGVAAGGAMAMLQGAGAVAGLAAAAPAATVGTVFGASTSVVVLPVLAMVGLLLVVRSVEQAAGAREGPQPGKFMVATKGGWGKNVTFYAFECEDESLRFFHNLSVALPKVVFCPNRRELQIALHSASLNRFVRVLGDRVDARGGVRDANDLPDDWDSERLTVVDAGHGMVALHSRPHGRFLRIEKDGAMSARGVRDVDLLPDAWDLERFSVRLVQLA
ncbi:hypothetical protein FOA52_007869 [Chlamydomonas sp. UWO 241]|nr:hypothetical protein FOA52_007869 [Chlamydomonas sp. UWO 241]